MEEVEELDLFTDDLFYCQLLTYFLYKLKTEALRNYSFIVNFKGMCTSEDKVNSV